MAAHLLPCWTTALQQGHGAAAERVRRADEVAVGGVCTDGNLCGWVDARVAATTGLHIVEFLTYICLYGDVRGGWIRRVLDRRGEKHYLAFGFD